MPEAVAAPQQAELPIATPAPAKARFVIPDDPKPETPVADSPAPKVEVKNTEEQAPSDAPDADKPDTETPEQAAKRQGRRFERKLGAAYKRAAEAQARAEFLEKQLEETRRTQQPQAEGEPRIEQFDYDPEKYAAAKADFAKKQALTEYEAKQRTEAQKNAHQALVSEWEKKVDRATDKYEDFADIVGELTPNSAFVAAIMEADNGEDIAYHLGKNPKEAERIAKLPPLTQIREIGKLEAKLLAEPVKPKTPSKAPAPITPVTGTAPVATTEPSEEDNMDAWMRKRNKQVNARRH